MDAERKVTINGNKISEYWWAGKFIVYINNRASDLSFESACERAKNIEKSQITNLTKGEI